MAIGYGLMWAYQFVLPVVGLLVGWLVLTRILRPFGRGIAWGLSGIVVAIGAMVPIGFERYNLSQDFAAVVVDEVRGAVDLPPGKLLYLSAGAQSCFFVCPDFVALDSFTDAGFLRLMGWGGISDQPLEPIDLNAALETDAGEYAYILLEMPAYRLPVFDNRNDFRLPHWPPSVQDVVLLVEMPQDGILDLRDREILFKRYILQLEQTAYLFWPTGGQTIRVPTFADIAAEMGDTTKRGN